MHFVGKAADRSLFGSPAISTLALLALATLILAGCGGTTTPTGGDAVPPPPPAPLSFAAIAGEWAGPGSDVNSPLSYDLDMALQPEAIRGAQIGSIEYSGMITCGGNLFALEAGGSEWAVEEQIVVGRGKPECANGGTIRLEHDAASDVLSWEWYVPNGPLIATGVLTRKG